MVLDAPSLSLDESLPPSDTDSDSEHSTMDFSNEHGDGDIVERRARGNKQRGLGELRISGLLRMVLQDAQTRLVFKAQSVMQSEIRWYVPRGEDLEWPGVLERAKGTSASIFEPASRPLLHVSKPGDSCCWTRFFRTVDVSSQG